MDNKDVKTEQSFVFIAPECAKDGQVQIISLPHPKTKKLTKYLTTRCEKETKLFEIKRHQESQSSWFIDTTVQKDGSTFVSTPFDPLFMLLPFLKTANPGKFVLLNQLLTDVDPILKECFGDQKQLELVADSAGSGDMMAFRYNEEKTINWLEKKANRLTKVIKDVGIFVFEKNETGNCEETEHLRYACGMLGDYIDSSLSKKLLQHLKLPEKTEKRKSHGPNSSAKKIKTEALEDYSKTVTSIAENKTKLSRSQKILNKVDKKGMKSINSFFKPKAKKEQ